MAPLAKSLLLQFLLVSLSTAQTQTCYWPTGDVATGYTSCNEASQISNCCNQDSVCLSNGFCMSQKSFGNRLLRGACTDKNWGAGCQQVCKDAFTGGQCTVLLMSDFDPGTYCCGNNDGQGNCGFASAGSKEPFRGPGNGAVVWNRKTGSTDWSLINNSSTTATATVTVAATGTSIPASSGSTGLDQSCPKNNTAAVGAGLGAGLGALLALVGGMLIWQTRKRKEAERRLQEILLAPPAHYEAGAQGYDESKGQNSYQPVDSTERRSELHGNYIGRPGTPELRA